MKRQITHLLITGMVMFSLQVLGQTPEVPFSASTHESILMTDQNGINVTYIKGTLNAVPAIYFMFKNNTNKTESFTWVLKDKNGDVVYTSQSLHVDAGQTIDYDNSENNMVSVTGITDFLFFLRDGVTFTDLKMEINL
jgi:hypothetical protein